MCILRVARIMLGALVLLWAASLRAANAVEPPLVQGQTVHGEYWIRGAFKIDVSSRVAWEVLTDYDHIGTFVTSMVASTVKSRSPEGIMLEQEALGRAFFFSKRVHVLLNVQEEVMRRISFIDVSRKDFELYEGSWTLEPSEKGLRVLYDLKARPRLKTPHFIGQHAFKVGAAKLLGEVRAEIFRRARGMAGR